MNLTFEQKLENYAELAVKVGLGLQAGQTLIIRAPVEAAPLVRLVVAKAYQAGAKLVEILWEDDAITLARFQYAPRDSFEEYPSWRIQGILSAVEPTGNGATLSIYAEDPDLLKDQDPELVATYQKTREQHYAPVRKLGMANHFNWCVISVPIESWAAKIFPGESPTTQMAKLWELIFQVCRVNEADPVAAWQQHAQTVTQVKDYLNAKQYAALKYTAPGTDFTLGLADHHLWCGVDSQTSTGITFIPNVPTEEVFTAPHKNKADGVVSSTKPLSYGGNLITNFSLTFEQGRVVKATADRGEAILKKLLDTDEGASRLGEVALVPHSSPISQTNILFYNTLFDENASNHLAIGQAYRFCMQDGADLSDAEFAAAGGNKSLTHVDFMIGSAEMDIDGLTRDGVTEPVMRGGEWAF